MKVLGVDYVYFPVADLEKATAFYRDVLGLTPVFSMGGMWGELQAGETTVALHVADDAPVAPSDSGMRPSAAFACEGRGSNGRARPRSRRERGHGAVRIPRVPHGDRQRPGRQPRHPPPAEGRLGRLARSACRGSTAKREPPPPAAGGGGPAAARQRAVPGRRPRADRRSATGGTRGRTPVSSSWLGSD